MNKLDKISYLSFYIRYSNSVFTETKYMELPKIFCVGWPTWSCLYCTQRGVPCWLAHLVLSILYSERLFCFPWLPGNHANSLS